MNRWRGVIVCISRRRPTWLLVAAVAFAGLQFYLSNLRLSISPPIPRPRVPAAAHLDASSRGGGGAKPRQTFPHSSKPLPVGGTSTSTSTSTGSVPTGAAGTSTMTFTLERGPIFYHVFAPADNSSNTERIVSEQLVQQLQYSDHPKDAIMQYTLIGDERFQGFMDRACPQCQLREVRRTGDEGHTLQAVWEYCHSTPTNTSHDTLVTYLHDKGSFHATVANEKARRMATKAALECRENMVQASNPRACNICTGAFHIFPQYLGSANMWTARCSYVKQLLAPTVYPMAMQEMFDTTLNHTIRQYWSEYVCLKPHHNAPNFWGVGRYALERWPFSHPNVKPCDILTVSEGDASLEEFPQRWTPRLQQAPRGGSAKSAGIETGPYKSTWARLSGRLFEWNVLYNQTPPKTSWIWSFYKGYEDGAPGFLKKCRSQTQDGMANTTIVTR